MHANPLSIDTLLYYTLCRMLLDYIIIMTIMMVPATIVACINSLFPLPVFFLFLLTQPTISVYALAVHVLSSVFLCLSFCFFSRHSIPPSLSFSIFPYLFLYDCHSCLFRIGLSTSFYLKNVSKIYEYYSADDVETLPFFLLEKILNFTETGRKPSVSFSSSHIFPSRLFPPFRAKNIKS